MASNIRNQGLARDGEEQRGEANKGGKARYGGSRADQSGGKPKAMVKQADIILE